MDSIANLLYLMLLMSSLSFTYLATRYYLVPEEPWLGRFNLRIPGYSLVSDARWSLLASMLLPLAAVGMLNLLGTGYGSEGVRRVAVLSAYLLSGVTVASILSMYLMTFRFIRFVFLVGALIMFNLNLTVLVVGVGFCVLAWSCEDDAKLRSGEQNEHRS